MNINITYPKFKAFVVSGGAMQYAVGYKFYAFQADSVPSAGTAVDTYSDPDCTSANTWPVVLDSLGEASIYVKEDIKGVLSAPTGDYSTPVWSIDNLSPQQNTTIVSGNATAGTTNNNYVLAVVPPFTAPLPDNLTIVMNPDTDSLDTLGSPVHTGTGINDLTFSGAYIGSTSGSVFSVEMMGVNAPVAVTIAENVAAGLVTIGNHYVKITAVTATGVSPLSSASNVVNAAGARKIDVTGIPAVSGLITAYNIYMTKAGGTDYYYVAQVIATTYTISVADASLTVLAPTFQSATDWIRWKKDGGAWTDQVLLTAADQIMIEGVSFKFSQIIGHTVGDLWTVSVTTPARLNFCGVGNKLIYKNEAGALVALDGGDMVEDIPATLVYSSTQDCYILNNPSLPVLEALKPYRERIDLTGAYAVTENDIGKELNCTGTFALTWPACATLASHWWWVRNSGTGTITLTANGTEVFKYSALVAGASTLALYPGQMVMIVTNGVDLHVAGYNMGGFVKRTYLTSGTSHTTQATTRTIFAQLVGGGAGGGGAADGGGGPPAGLAVGGGGGSGGYAEKVFAVSPSTAYTYAIGVAGAAGTAVGTQGGAGGNTTFTVGATTVTANGGTGGGAFAVTFSPGGAGGVISVNGDLNLTGINGDYGVAMTTDIMVIGGKGGDSRFGAGGIAGSDAAGAAATGYGGGGGGASKVGTGGAGNAGGVGTAGLIIVTEYN